MRKGKALGWFLPVGVLFAGLVLVPAVSGQNNKQAEDQEAIRQLLAEVRLLRQALETVHRMNLDTYRSQLLAERIRANREDVRRLNNSLNETRDTLAKTQNAIPQSVDRLKLLESQVQLEVDQQKRADLEFEAKRTKQGIEMYKSQIESLKEREQQLAAELNTEKNKLNELENRLELLERAFENDRQKLDSESKTASKNP